MDPFSPPNKKVAITQKLPKTMIIRMESNGAGHFNLTIIQIKFETHKTKRWRMLSQRHSLNSRPNSKEIGYTDYLKEPKEI